MQAKIKHSTIRNTSVLLFKYLSINLTKHQTLTSKGRGIFDMTIIEKIKAHEKEVQTRQLPDDLEICPKCGASSRHFKLHASRARLFLVIVDFLVKEIRSILGRWKCALCLRTSTYYPDYAIPYKRYTKNTILELSKKYIEEKYSTYESVVQNDMATIVYDSKNNSSKYECRLRSTTLWWWLSSIGSMHLLINKAFSLIRQKDPLSKVFREIQAINPRKYRSNKRKNLLQGCMEVLNIEDECRRLFSKSVFPHFAIQAE